MWCYLVLKSCFIIMLSLYISCQPDGLILKRWKGVNEGKNIKETNWLGLSITMLKHYDQKKIYLEYPELPSLSGGQWRDSRHEIGGRNWAAAMEECCSLLSLSNFPHLSFLYVPGPPAQEMVPPTVDWTLLHQENLSQTFLQTNLIDTQKRIETLFFRKF